MTTTAIKNPYLYTGRQLDEETGLYYYRARHYSAEMRRFIQRDPLEYVDGPNALAYCAASVVVGGDSSGLAHPSVHKEATRASMSSRGYSASFTEKVAQANADVDENQEPAYAEIHGQRAPGESVAQAQEAVKAYRDQLLKRIAEAQDEDSLAQAMGQLLHLEQDILYHNYCRIDGDHGADLLGFLRFFAELPIAIALIPFALGEIAVTDGSEIHRTITPNVYFGIQDFGHRRGLKEVTEEALDRAENAAPGILLGLAGRGPITPGPVPLPSPKKPRPGTSGQERQSYNIYRDCRVDGPGGVLPLPTPVSAPGAKHDDGEWEFLGFGGTCKNEAKFHAYRPSTKTRTIFDVIQ